MANAFLSLIGGGGSNEIKVGGGSCVVGAFIGGGSNNNNASCSGNYSAIIGGSLNNSFGGWTFIGGGTSNSACGAFDVVLGGKSNINFGVASAIIGGTINCVFSGTSFIGGGYQNQICCGSPNSIILGGQKNQINSYGANKSKGNSIGGGYQNIMFSDGSENNSYGNTIGGGYAHAIYLSKGASFNTILGGEQNLIYGCFNTISGGTSNTINGYCNVHIAGSAINASANNYFLVNNLIQSRGGISDCRVKCGINDWTIGLEEIVKLNPVSFCFSKNLKKKKFGFLAQEICAVIPSIVSCNKMHRFYEGDEFLDRTCSKGVPLLQFDKKALYVSYANAIKQIKSSVELMKLEIDNLKNG